MSLVLTTTWRPQGELPRLQRLLPMLHECYDAIYVVLAEDNPPDILEVLDAMPRVDYSIVNRIEAARSVSLEMAVGSDAGHIHYCDMDRLIRWGETQPDELRATTAAIQEHDAVMIGRTNVAFATHPHALIETETLLLDVTEYLLGKRLDVASGSKAFSRAAAAFLVTHGESEFGLGTDMVWPILLHRGGFDVTGLLVDGLDWETADRFLPHAADAALQREEAAAYDTDADRWAMRVGVAQRILQAGLAAMRAPLPGVPDADGAGPETESKG